jgi:hypothetical protein
MRAAICPYCGSPTVPAGLVLPRIKQLILSIVQKRPGIDAEALRAVVWADDPAGGPEDRKVLHVHVHQLNRRLAPLGIAVRGGTGGYRLIAISRRPRRNRPNDREFLRKPAGKRPARGRSVRVIATQ